MSGKQLPIQFLLKYSAGNWRRMLEAIDTEHYSIGTTVAEHWGAYDAIKHAIHRRADRSPVQVSFAYWTGANDASVPIIEALARKLGIPTATEVDPLPIIGEIHAALGEIDRIANMINQRAHVAMRESRWAEGVRGYLNRIEEQMDYLQTAIDLFQDAVHSGEGDMVWQQFVEGGTGILPPGTKVMKSSAVRHREFAARWHLYKQAEAAFAPPGAKEKRLAASKAKYGSPIPLG